METALFAKVDFTEHEVSESLARAYAVAIRIKQPPEGAVPEKTIKESPAIYGIRGEPPKPQRKPKKKEVPPEQLRLF